MPQRPQELRQLSSAFSRLRWNTLKQGFFFPHITACEARGEDVPFSISRVTLWQFRYSCHCKHYPTEILVKLNDALKNGQFYSQQYLPTSTNKHRTNLNASLERGLNSNIVRSLTDKSKETATFREKSSRR